MIDLQNIILWFIGFANLFLGFTFFYKSQKKEEHMAYVLFVLSIFAWAVGIALFRQNTNLDKLLLYNQLFIIFAALIGSSLLHFSFVFPSQKAKVFSWNKRVLIYIPNILIILGTLTPGVLIENIVIQDWGNESILGWGYIYFALYFAIIVCWAFFNLYKTYISGSRVIKVQLLYVGIGLFCSLLIGSIFNLFFILLGNYQWIWLGPYASIIMLVSVGYAIVRHRFLDVRFILRYNFVRFSLGILALSLFYLLIWILSEWFGSLWTFGAVFTAAIIILIFAYLFPFIERIVLYICNNYLYTQITDVQNSVDYTTKRLTTILNKDKILDVVSNAFQTNFQIENIAIVLESFENDRYEVCKFVGFKKSDLNDFLNEKELLQYFLFYRDWIVSVELDSQIEDLNSSQNKKNFLFAFKKIVEKINVSLICPLFIKDRLIGCILLGEKEKGIFTSNDISFLEKIINQLIFALDNAETYNYLDHLVKKKTDELEKKLTENQHLLTIKTQFLQVISHQLRTPISAARSSLALVLEDCLNTEHPSKERLRIAKDMVKSASLAVENLFHTSEHMLAASEITDQHVQPKLSLIRTEDFFKERIRKAEELLAIRQSDVQFHVEIDDTLPKKINTDQELLAESIDILLSNAILYTEKGTITLSARKRGEQLEVLVKDTGIGIPEDKHHKIFERFVRLTNAVRVIPDGSGLGLYLAKKYCEALQGTLTFESTEGKGSTFTLSVPVRFQYIVGRSI